MAKILIYACGRCGEPFREGGSGWFRNNQREWCHQCADGVIGGRERRDPAKPRPKLPDDAGRCDDLRKQVSKSLAAQEPFVDPILPTHQLTPPITATEAAMRDRTQRSEND